MSKQSMNEQLHNQQAAGKQATAAQAGGQQSGDQWGGGKQQQQYDAGEGGQFATQIRDRMEVIGADGTRIGRLDTVEGNRIRFATADLEPMSRPDGVAESWLPLDKVQSIHGDKLQLKINAAEFTRTVDSD